VGRPDFKSGKGRQSVLGGFDSHSFPPAVPRCRYAGARIAIISRIPAVHRYNARMNVPTLKIIADLADIPAADWDALAGDDPFVSHAYLYALQQSGCATARFGWQARFITLWQDGRLLGAMPLYLKMNSYGEHVFDFAWADAYRRSGLRYYPKLVCTVPFTPVTGPRLLAAPGADRGQVRALLLDSALRFAKESGVSSLHCLFLDEDDMREAEAQGMLLRRDVQFHWRNEAPLQNRGYRDFDDYLAALSRDKRKRIKQERRKVAEAGITLQCVTGEHATREQWAFFASCYSHTRQMHHSPPALNEDFFQRIGASMPRHTLLVIASREGRMIASALNIVTDQVLYGRSWGAFEYHPGLHFEACYYQAIEFCIARGIRTFEGGAQGEHKLARGFLPVTTTSAHWLAHPQFARAVEDYLQQETGAISEYVDELNLRSPFRQM
jgi:predicted N-acyltransferase